MALHPEILTLIKQTGEVLEPETLRQVHPELTESELNEVLALSVLMKTRGYWENLFIFEDITHALNGRIPDPTRIEGALPEDIWYALDIAHKLFPDREYSIEVLKYIEFNFNEAGTYVFPEYLPLLNPYYSTAVYKAQNGPFPLGESDQDIQAAKYMVIQEYISKKKGII